MGESGEEIIERKNVGSVCKYWLGTMTLNEKEEEKLRIAENNWVGRMCKIMREDRQDMKVLMEYIGMENILIGKYSKAG